MSLIPRDPLLTAARLIINFFIAIFGLVIAAIAAGIPLALLNQDRIVRALADDGKVVVAGDFMLGLSAMLLMLAVVLALAIWFLMLLRQIVATVAAGDPFISDNADRLGRMGWIAVGVELLSIPLGAAVIWIAGMVEDSDTVRLDDDVGFSGSGIVLILVLFILARVFRQGAAMRADLEGTV